MSDPCQHRASAVILDDVTVAFGNGRVALDSVSLDVEDGEFVSVIGPSGCGKTTILRVIAGLTEPTGGSVHTPTNGSGMGSGREDIGYVFQDATLMPWASVFSNVWLPLKLRGVSKVQARPRITDMLDRVGLADVADAYPNELSGGMKMRVSIARALVTGPRLLLMDEPFAALDEITRFKLNDDLLALREGVNCTVVFVTHSVFESVYLSNRVVVMTSAPGRIAGEVAIDMPHPRTADFRQTNNYSNLCVRSSEMLQKSIDNLS